MSTTGGAAVIRRAVELFYQRVLADPSLTHYFDGVDLAALRSHQRSFLIAALGGPELYSGRDMRSAHQGLGITDSEFDLAVGHLGTSLDDAGVDAAAAAGIRRQLEPLRHQIVD